MNVRIHTLFIVNINDTHVLYYGEYMSCSSRPSPASVGRVATEAKLTLQHIHLYNNSIGISKVRGLKNMNPKHLNLRYFWVKSSSGWI